MRWRPRIGSKAKMAQLKQAVLAGINWDIHDGIPPCSFRLKGIDGAGNEKEYRLSDLLREGSEVVLYFYPKDNTPGCTQEACDFRDNFNRITGKALVVGVSRDSIASHRNYTQ
jgi:peroxiredoxin Q/BCP